MEPAHNQAAIQIDNGLFLHLLSLGTRLFAHEESGTETNTPCRGTNFRTADWQCSSLPWTRLKRLLHPPETIHLGIFTPQDTIILAFLLPMTPLWDITILGRVVSRQFFTIQNKNTSAYSILVPGMLAHCSILI